MRGELGVESAKTINMTSAVLACNVDYQNICIEKVKADCFRRCLTFSLYKHMDVCERATSLLSKLTFPQLKALFLDSRIMMEKSEPRHLLNVLYFDDFCILLGGKDFQW